MSSQTNTAVAAPAPLTDEQVARFLERNPDFLSRNPDLLETLEIHHSTGPAAVSLIERQVEMLRGKIARLEDRLGRLVGNAEDNQQRAGNVHRLARGSACAPTLAGVARGLAKAMKDEFDVDAVFIGVFAPTLKRHDIEGLTRIDARSKIVAEFGDFFRTRIIECGPIGEARSKLLFPNADPLPASAAVVPLEKENNLGMLVLGSRDPDRFHAKQGKLFLEMTAELVSAALRARLG